MKADNKGMIWPYAIGVSIIVIFGACVATVVVANKLPVEKSDTYMMGYHEADDKANDIINAAISFNKKYKVEYLTNSLHVDASTIKYRVTDVDSNPVNNAEIKVVITRPNNHKYDQELSSPKIQNGIYTFDVIELAKEGRWDIMAKITIGKEQRFYNLKADTRNKEVYEY